MIIKTNLLLSVFSYRDTSGASIDRLHDADMVKNSRRIARSNMLRPITRPNQAKPANQNDPAGHQTEFPGVRQKDAGPRDRSFHY